ncbi:hypothetical protein EJ08DRAFT_638669 [Tothia fuscella]|uniref:Peroxisomal membrane protein PEX14 n=1 Tax=Tothia fuscella TaxID=1048955 RepID=A0A9P4NKQ5_9PEZI|nr:hypothetical protein EJ08DRAFT_638669 [Tothia fuscella]
MIREDLINSAVTFLQDPSVAQAPLDKKIAFLQSKNLTPEEVDVALSRVGDPPASSIAGPPQSYPYRQPAPSQAGYGAYPGAYWPQQPPPELPKRDWRDWFIMATVMGGVGYGIYFTAKRYIVPLIAPPTPPQIIQDKTSIDESFEKAFALLDQLNTDTAALKAAEESRTTRLDTTLGELESVLSSLKDSDRKREEDARRNAEDIRGLRDLIPKALDAQKEVSDSRLKELGTELKSLKTLVGNRMSSSTPAPITQHKTAGSGSGIGYTPSSSAAIQNGASAGSPPPVAQNLDTNGGGPVSGPQASTVESPNTSASSSDHPQSSASSVSGRFGSGKATIPAWQLAAAKKSQETLNGEKRDTSTSGTAVEASTS